MNETKYDLIMPSIRDDIWKIKKHYKLLKKYLPVKKIVVIGNDTVRKEISDASKELIFINENELIPYNSVKKAISKRDESCVGRTGWYYQQFLKMKYAEVCNDKYYLIWDSDMIPLKRLDFFDKGYPCFDLSDEFNKPYFDTMAVLLPGLVKTRKESFIAEHMMIQCEWMRELIAEIEKNTCILGSEFWEKIINAINIKDLPNSGFSEFETYGTFVETKHPGKYKKRKWKAFRLGGLAFTPDNLNINSKNWLSKYYSAISFEKWLSFHQNVHMVYRNIIFQTMIPSCVAVKMLEFMRFICFIERKVKRKILRIGR